MRSNISSQKTESPQTSRTRSKKIGGGRVQCIVYLPKDEVDQIDETVEATGSSRSHVIAQTYFQGKGNQKKNSKHIEG